MLLLLMNVSEALREARLVVLTTLMQYAHPSLVIHIKMLIQLIVKHSYVPEGFGLGLVIPLVKDKSGNLNDSDNYRGITIGP